MASVRKRKWTHKGVEKEAWVVSYTDQSGNRRQKTFEKKKEADSYRRSVESEIERGEHVAASASASIQCVAKAYLRNLDQRLALRQISQWTNTTYSVVVNNHILPHIGAIKISGLEFSALESYADALRGKGLSERRVRDCFDILALIEDFAVRRKLTRRRVVKEAKRALTVSTRASVTPFTIEQVRALVSALDKRPAGQHRHTFRLARCFVILAALCGLRFSEIRALSLDDIDLDAGFIRIRHGMDQDGSLKPPKTRAGIRSIPISEGVGRYLRDFIDHHYQDNDDRLIFRAGKRTAGTIRQQNFRKQIWIPLLERSGIGPSELGEALHFHALRHFAASAMIDRGELSIPDISKIMGHSNISTTLNIYTHSLANLEKRRSAIANLQQEFLPQPAPIGMPVRCAPLAVVATAQQK